MLNKMFDEFNNQYGLEKRSIYDRLPEMHDLIEDERKELADEIFDTQDGYDPNYEDVVKEAIDIIYITCQQLRERGVDVDSALEEVHRSNMSKTLIEGWMVKDEVENASIRYPNVKVDGNVMKCGKTGKVIKPTTYSPAVITDAMIGKE